MSNPDSFIDEVTEEVRRDRLFRAFRRYGWIGVVLVAAIVGGAAYNEWQKASRTATAQALGDGLTAALAAGTPEARAAALDGLKVQGAEQAALKALMRASDPAQDREGAIAALRTVEADATLAPVCIVQAPPLIERSTARLRFETAKPLLPANAMPLTCA